VIRATPLDRFTVTHDAAGLKRMAARPLHAGVEQVGIERTDGEVVHTLMQAGLTVYVIPPSQVKNLRSRYGSAGNEDDRFDAYVPGVEPSREELLALVAAQAGVIEQQA
jgi:transposase